MSKLLLLDGNSMLFRAYYATLYTHRMSTSNGIPTNAVFGFIMMLNKAIDIIKPDSILVAWDAGKPTFRHKQFAAYKGTRKPLDEDLIVQFPIVREFLDATGIKRFEIEGYEADDIIGSMAKTNSKGMTTILTSDRDLLQLIDDTTHVLLMKKGLSDMDLMDVENFKEKYNLMPKQIIDLKGIMGDSSDNIPGVAGIGEKGATKLLVQYGSLENVYENIDQIKGKQKEKLLNDKDNAFMSKELATIYTSMDFPFTIQDCKFDGYDEKVNDFYQKYEMRSLISKTTMTSKSYQIKTICSFKGYDSKDLLLMPVNSKEAYLNQKLYGFMFFNNEEVLYLKVEDALEDSYFKNMLKHETSLRTWDAKEMMHLLQRYGFYVPSFKEDLHLAAFLLHSQATDTDSLISSLGIELPETIHDLLKKAKTLEACHIDRLLPVTCAWTWQLSIRQDNIFDELKKDNLLDLYENIEKPLVRILFEMENQGIHIDENVLDEIGAKTDTILESLTQQIYEMAHMVFNINSPKQLAGVLYDELNLKGGGKKRSTSAEVLEKLKGSHPIIDVLLDYRKYSKIKSTYIEGLKKHIQQDLKIHTCFNQAMTQTGRLSSSDPNLQNISVRDEQGREIRKAFVAQKGYKLLSADYSQIELRMLAHMANETHMIEAFKEGADIHNRTASHIFHVSQEDVTPDMRRVAKTVNFGIVYGQTEFGLSQQLKISRKEAGEFMETYFASYPNIHQFMNQLIDFCKENGYVETMFHRRRMIPEINDKNFMTREFGKRAAMNAPIQGSAADLIKIAMIRVDQAMKEKNVKSKMLLQIHDELIFLVPDDELEVMQALVKEAMEQAMELKVPLKASINFGQSWYEAK